MELSGHCGSGGSWLAKFQRGSIGCCCEQALGIGEGTEGAEGADVEAKASNGVTCERSLPEAGICSNGGCPAVEGKRDVPMQGCKLRHNSCPAIIAE